MLHTQNGYYLFCMVEVVEDIKDDQKVRNQKTLMAYELVISS